MDTTCNGALGSLTFGIYHYYISMKQIELHNKKLKTNADILK